MNTYLPLLHILIRKTRILIGKNISEHQRFDLTWNQTLNNIVFSAMSIL